jgi:hypothetical protein
MKVIPQAGYRRWEEINARCRNILFSKSETLNFTGHNIEKNNYCGCGYAHFWLPSTAHAT